MKELSIEQKAQRYDEALKVAKGLYAKDAPDSLHLERMFPVLKESEDERIRKSLIKHFREYKSCTFDGLTSTKVLAWLERQDKGTNWKPSKEEMDVLYGLAYITNQYDEHKEEVITRLYQDLKREFFNGSSYENMFPNTEDGVRRRSTIQVLEYARSLDTYNQYGKADIDKNIAWLEKQGKIDEDLIAKKFLINKGYPIDANGTFPTYEELYNIIREGLENQCEQKPIPKFKVGDTMRTLQEANNGYIDGMPVVVSIDNEYYHCTNELIAIKDQDDYEFPPINVKQNLVNKIESKFKVGDEIKTANEEPLTITKIDEKGYWSEDLFICGFGDAAKWELVGKSISKIDPKFHEGDWVVVSTIKGDRVVQIASVEYLKDGYPSYITTEGRWFGNGTKARLLTDKDVEIATIPESKIVVSKSKYWSEEDEDTLAAIIAIIRKQYNGTNIEEKKYYNVLINWLKSLKDRVYPKQEWKQENTDDLYKLKML